MEAREVLIGLGANLGEPLVQLRRAMERLSGLGTVDAVSSVYRTEPVGFRDQPEFFNLVCRLRTHHEPVALLHAVLEVERELGRRRSFANAPRTLDIDLLSFEGVVLESEELTLPHPRLHQRAFVLVPLAEIAPAWRHPLLGKTAGELLAEAGPLERVVRWGELPP